MSLEIALQENTAALRDLMNLLSSGVAALPAAPALTAEGSEAPARPKKAKVEKPVAAAGPRVAIAVDENGEHDEETAVVEQRVAETVAAVEQAAAEQPAAETPAVPVTVNDCKDLILAIASKKGRAAAAELLGKFGAAKLSEVPASKYAELKAAAEKVLQS